MLDKEFYRSEYLMGEEFARSYHAFMEACFLTYTGLARPAQLRASRNRQRAQRPDWEDAWDDLLIADTMTPTGLAELGRHYDALMLTFSTAIGVRPADVAETTRAPST